MKAFSIRIKGKVQGVGFRYFVYRTAKHLGVCGIVRNCSNGDVFVEAEANDEVLVKFIQECSEGPIRSNVRDVDINAIEFNGYSSFEITG